MTVGVMDSLHVFVIVSLKRLWENVHAPLYKNGALSVILLQIVCLPLSPP